MATVDNSKTQTLYQLGTAFFWLAGGLFAYALLAWVLSWKVFALHTVRVTGGVQHITKAQVTLISQRVLKGNFFSVDMEAMRVGFEKLPWVHEAKVARLWPSTLVIHLTENIPFARWGDHALVNPEGEVFEAAWNGNLPQFNGPDDTSHQVMEAFLQYEKILAPLKSPVALIELSPRLTWRLRLVNGLELALGRQDADLRLARFAMQYPSLETRLNGQLRYVDLRYPDGFAVRLGPPASRQSAPTERS
ncbi:MAG: cell division protein FtsQ/DivIB [Thiobacillaceae bacterium]|jgi:cell division protein FtsQ